jgi:hypothetical protein
MTLASAQTNESAPHDSAGGSAGAPVRVLGVRRPILATRAHERRSAQRHDVGAVVDVEPRGEVVALVEALAETLLDRGFLGFAAGAVVAPSRTETPTERTRNKAIRDMRQ